MSEYSSLNTDVCRLLADIMSIASVNDEDDLLELGIGSLAAMQFIDALNEKINTSFPVTILFEFPTIKSLLSHADIQPDHAIPYV